MVKSNLIASFCTALCLSGLCLSQAHAVSLSGQGSWETTLQARDLDGNTTTAEAYYDTVLDITWLADANYALTSGYDDGDPNSSGDDYMVWAEANNWAGGLNLFGYQDWRLPDANPINGSSYLVPPLLPDSNGNLVIIDDEQYSGDYDIGYNITAPGTAFANSLENEMAYMFFHTLGNLALVDTSGAPQTGSGVSNSGPFSNLGDFFFWSGQTGPVYSTTNALGFGFKQGRQRSLRQIRTALAWAVTDGDIGTAAIITSPVPVPAAAWLFASGLLGLVGVARRNPHV